MSQADPSAEGAGGDAVGDAADGEVVLIRLPAGAGGGAQLDADSGGDAACWANRVCPECGRLNGAAHPQVCEACGADFDR